MVLGKESVAENREAPEEDFKVLRLDVAKETDSEELRAKLLEAGETDESLETATHIAVKALNGIDALETTDDQKDHKRMRLEQLLLAQYEQEALDRGMSAEDARMFGAQKFFETYELSA